MSRKNPKIKLDASVGYPQLGRTEGQYEIDATQITDTFAVNRDLRIDEDGDVDYHKTWNVSHIPTGCAMVRGLPTSQSAKAAAALLEAMGYGDITSADPEQANEEVLNRGGAGLKSWFAGLISSSRTSKSLTEKIKKETSRVSRMGRPPQEALPTAPRGRKPRRGARVPRKAAKRKTKRDVDLPAMARKARENPKQGVSETKERLLNW